MRSCENCPAWVKLNEGPWGECHLHSPSGFMNGKRFEGYWPATTRTSGCIEPLPYIEEEGD